MTDSARDDAETARLLTAWTEQLGTALGIDPTAVDIDAVLGLAGVAARAVVRPAAPLTTFLVGYAAGLAAAGGVAPADAIARAAAVARAEVAGIDPGARAR